VTRAERPLAAVTLSDERLVLEPLRVEHADEMAGVLGDPALYMFTGGEPPSAAQLRDRYGRQTVGRSPDGAECWLNWVIRRRDGDAAVGFVQATVSRGSPGQRAEIAWVIGTDHQGVGFARDAARLMVDWLGQQGVAIVTAHVHPDHRASAAVARRVGLTPTDRVVDGEVRWTNGK
jgi:RimJ/RimL family protein N-acetyltransferase